MVATFLVFKCFSHVHFTWSYPLVVSQKERLVMKFNGRGQNPGSAEGSCSTRQLQDSFKRLPVELAPLQEVSGIRNRCREACEISSRARWKYV